MDKQSSLRSQYVSYEENEGFLIRAWLVPFKAYYGWILTNAENIFFLVDKMAIRRNGKLTK